MTDTCLVFKNLFGYDPVPRVPGRMPPGMTPVYITDSQSDKRLAESYGWTAYCIDEYNGTTDSFEKRKVIAKINCYPEQVVPDLLEYTYIFICDSNVVTLDSNYEEFVKLAKNGGKPLFVTSGYYSGRSNTMNKELMRSLGNGRWSYNFDKMQESTYRYLHTLRERNLSIDNTPVVSAKFIGWNIKSEFKSMLADIVYNEYMIHLQGNIIFSYVLQIHPEHVEHYTGFKNDCTVRGHLISL
jgi:hypothetical protein